MYLIGFWLVIVFANWMAALGFLGHIHSKESPKVETRIESPAKF